MGNSQALSGKMDAAAPGAGRAAQAARTGVGAVGPDFAATAPVGPCQLDSARFAGASVCPGQAYASGATANQSVAGGACGGACRGNRSGNMGIDAPFLNLHVFDVEAVSNSNKTYPTSSVSGENGKR